MHFCEKCEKRHVRRFGRTRERNDSKTCELFRSSSERVGGSASIQGMHLRLANYCHDDRAPSPVEHSHGVDQSSLLDQHQLGRHGHAARSSKLSPSAGRNWPDLRRPRARPFLAPNTTATVATPRGPASTVDTRGGRVVCLVSQRLRRHRTVIEPGGLAMRSRQSFSVSSVTAGPSGRVSWLPRRASIRSVARRIALGAVIALAASAAFGFTATRALACDGSNTFGTQGLNWRGAGNDNGTRAWLQGSSILSSCGTAIASVAIQNGGAQTTTGGIQTGYYKGTSTAQTDCGTAPLGVFTEYLPVGGNYHCIIFSSSIFGAGDQLTVHHDSTNGWQTFENGTAELPNPLTSSYMGFATGNSFARGEVHWTSNLPTFDVTWGPSGQTHWQYMTSSSGTYSDVQSYANGTSHNGTYFDTQDTDNDWNVGTSGADPPSPFDIKWIG
jgi:hypothetical protein